MPGTVPDNPKIYHITKVTNLPRIIREGGLASDRKCMRDRINFDLIGMPKIKRRRLEEITVDCHPGTHVGDYVPFYFCPRSIMLFILHKGNHPDITYRDGQGPIVHLRADLRAVVKWAEKKGLPWAFSNRNAGGYLADFYCDLNQLDEINWNAIGTNQWQDALIKEGKQAEFLLHDWFPWELVESIGVQNNATLALAQAAVNEADHRPTVQVRTSWYY